METHPLISIRSTATVQEAARLMADCSIGALGVLGPEKKFTGLVTERDLSWFVAQDGTPSETRVSEIVNDFPVVMDGPVSDADALERMKAARIRHLIVREETDFQIVSLRDLIPHRDVDDGSGPTARDLMTAPAVACLEEAFFEEIAEILAERDISGMPVVDREGKVVGVISERDLAHVLGGPMVRLAVRSHRHGSFMRANDLPRNRRRARDVMTTPPVMVGPEEEIEGLARLMRVHQINRVPVVESGRLIGVVTRGDVLGAVGHLTIAQKDLVQPPVLVGSTGIYPATYAEGETI